MEKQRRSRHFLFATVLLTGLLLAFIGFSVPMETGEQGPVLPRAGEFPKWGPPLGNTQILSCKNITVGSLHVADDSTFMWIFRLSVRSQNWMGKGSKAKSLQSELLQFFIH